MRSKVFFTEEMDDVEAAAEDIFDQAKDFVFAKNTMALLFIRDEMDYDMLLDLLRSKWSFPVIGTTTLGLFAGSYGYKKEGMSIMLMTADDVSFAVGMTGDLDGDNYMSEIKGLHDRLVAKLPCDEEEKLILCYSGQNRNVNGDNIIAALDAAAPKVPVYGGLASDTFSFIHSRIHSRVFCNDRMGTSVQAMAVISGNIHPLYTSITSVSGKTKFSYEVTKSEGNIVFELEGIPFRNALKKAGLEADKTEVIADYILSPFVSVLNKDGTTIEVLRDLSFLDHDKNFGVFLGGIEEGSSLEIGLLNRKDVHDTVRVSFKRFLDRCSTDGIERNTIFCTSCAARYLAIGGAVDSQNINFWDELPDDKELIGMYSYGEYCPVDTKDKTGINIFHNSTFTMMMI